MAITEMGTSNSRRKRSQDVVERRIGSLTYRRRGQVEGAILKNVEELGERFANAYLAAQEQGKTP